MRRTATRLPSHGDLIRSVFDRDALARVCRMDEGDFAAAYGLDTHKVAQASPIDVYYFQDNDAPILAVAHLDTVADASKREAHYVETEAGLVIYSRALDDRLGAYIILEMLPQLGVEVDVLLTVGEEVGRSTADFFEPPRDYNWMIEFDRGGTDVVLYQYEDAVTRDLVKASGAKVGDGIFSDISYLDHLECKGFNWGVGYEEYHTARSHAFLDDTWKMLGYFLNFYEDNADEYLPHDSRIGTRLYSEPWDYDDDDYDTTPRSLHSLDEDEWMRWMMAEDRYT